MRGLTAFTLDLKVETLRYITRVNICYSLLFQRDQVRSLYAEINGYTRIMQVECRNEVTLPFRKIFQRSTSTSTLQTRQHQLVEDRITSPDIGLKSLPSSIASARSDSYLSH